MGLDLGHEHGHGVPGWTLLLYNERVVQTSIVYACSKPDKNVVDLQLCMVWYC